MRACVAPFTYPGHPPQCLRASIDGIDLGERMLSDGWNDYTFEILPLPQQKSLQRTLRFKFCHAVSPASVNGSQSGDSRELAVVFDYVEFVPLE